MDKQQVLQSLDAHREQLHGFAVKTLLLFGSVARDEAHAESDVDLLVEFEQPVGLLTFIGLKQYLEEILGCSVDLGTPNSLRPYLKETVLKEAIRAF
ncbi:MAG: nucleotidyltransferase family protein [Cyanobacteriota bacterium]|nr:nucleotidyltransferase family protein [Cyanobacteriota bacterium]